MEVDLKEVSKNIDGLNTAFVAFKEEMKSKAPDPAKLAKIESDLATRDAANQKFVDEQEAKAKALADRFDEFEKKANRKDLGGAAHEQKTTEKKEAFGAYLRYGNPGVDVGAADKWARHAEQKGIKLETKAMTIADDTTGGYLADADYVKEIIKAEVLISPSRSLVKVRNTSNREVKLPKRTGTAAAVWITEQGTRAETQNPSYGLVECFTHEMTAEVYISMQDLEDSAFDLEAELMQEFAEQFAVTEGAAVIAGNGVGKPWGITDAGQGIAFTGSGTSGSIAGAAGAQGDPLINMVHAVKTAYANNGRFGLARQTLGSVRKLKDTTGRYLWEPSPAVGLPSMILGYPYTEVPDMPVEAANSLSIAFGDWKRAYTLVDRLSLSVVRDPFTKSAQGLIRFVGRRRIGGQVVLAEALRFLKCA